MSTSGTIRVGKVTYKIDVAHAFEQALVVSDRDQLGGKIAITDPKGDLQSELLAEHTRPTPGIRYVGNGRIRGTRRRAPRVSPKS